MLLFEFGVINPVASIEYKALWSIMLEFPSVLWPLVSAVTATWHLSLLSSALQCLWLLRSIEIASFCGRVLLENYQVVREMAYSPVSLNSPMHRTDMGVTVGI